MPVVKKELPVDSYPRILDFKDCSSKASLSTVHLVLDFKSHSNYHTGSDKCLGSKVHF